MDWSGVMYNFHPVHRAQRRTGVNTTFICLSGLMPVSQALIKAYIDLCVTIWSFITKRIKMYIILYCKEILLF
jgi:hypothetical protein